MRAGSAFLRKVCHGIAARKVAIRSTRAALALEPVRAGRGLPRRLLMRFAPEPTPAALFEVCCVEICQQIGGQDSFDRVQKDIFGD